MQFHRDAADPLKTSSVNQTVRSGTLHGTLESRGGRRDSHRPTDTGAEWKGAIPFFCEGCYLGEAGDRLSRLRFVHRRAFFFDGQVVVEEGAVSHELPFDADIECIAQLEHSVKQCRINTPPLVVVGKECQSHTGEMNDFDFI